MVKKERYHINLVGGVGPARGRGRDVGKEAERLKMFKLVVVDLNLVVADLSG